MANATVRVEGLAGLRRAFSAASKAEARGLTQALKTAAKPVESRAESLARSSIPRIALPSTKIAWSEMRTGTRARYVYVAPRQRGARGSRRARKRFAPILLQPMIQALHEQRSVVERNVDEMLGDVGRVWESTP